MPKPALDRFMALVVQTETDDCVPWPFHLDVDGYGVFHRLGQRRAHRVALIHSGQPVPFIGAQALHSCDNPPCVNPRHLRWGTHQDNMQDRVRRGTALGKNLGSAHGLAKLSEDTVHTLRERYAAGGVSYKYLAEGVGVSTMRVYDAINRRTWKHVP